MAILQIMVKIYNIYTTPKVAGQFRVLIDRLWPRALNKEKAAIDLWFKEIAPTPELRRWFGHQPEKFDAFSRRYIQELKTNPATDKLAELISDKPNTILLYGAKDSTHNHAVVLKRYLEDNYKLDRLPIHSTKKHKS